MGMISKALENRLIAQAKAGDGDAIAALIRSHQDALFAFILRMSQRPDVAEDIVQEAFVRVLKNIDRFDERFRFSTWLFTIARRLYVNAAQKRRPAYDSDMVAASEGKAKTPAGLNSRCESLENARDVIDSALSCLSEQQREIILLFHQQNWPITEIANHLNMPEGTVKSHLHRARKRMRRTIEANRTMTRHVEEILG
ncbi:MAG: RNA polymerase sigma factor [Planctomycetota bacterium]|nr:RNA polymerase sigma factor [Planctomycetota bacterium]